MVERKYGRLAQRKEQRDAERAAGIENVTQTALQRIIDQSTNVMERSYDALAVCDNPDEHTEEEVAQSMLYLRLVSKSNWKSIVEAALKPLVEREKLKLDQGNGKHTIQGVKTVRAQLKAVK